MSRIERKYMAHYIDADSTGLSPNYVRLGKDLEEFSTEYNANVNTSNNILGELSVFIDSYQPQSSIEPFYADSDSSLFARIKDICDRRLVLDGLKTTVVDVQLWDAVSTDIYHAYKEEAIIEIVSEGGDTTGLQYPFNVHRTGIRTKGTFTMATGVFTPDVGTLGTLYIDVAEGATSGKTKVSSGAGEGAGPLYYKTAAPIATPYYGQSSSGYTALTEGTDIASTAGYKIVIVEVSGGIVVSASSIRNVVVKA